MMDKKRLVVSILQFLNEELNDGTISGDAAEGLEVAIQCLETTYDVKPEDRASLPPRTLLQIFQEATSDSDHYDPHPEKRATSEEKCEAEQLKNEGNEFMRTGQFQDALERYSRAIRIDPQNPVYYCNRAAAYSKVNDHWSAIKDCQRAIDRDSKYSKAYGRMGLAYSSLKFYREAKDSYETALKLDPDNEAYRNNLETATEKMSEEGAVGGMHGIPTQDWGSFLTNPAFMNLATQMTSDPNMQQWLSNFISGGGDFDSIMEAGRRVAEQVQATNPELIDQFEQLRRQMGGGGQNRNSNANDQDDKQQ